MIKYIPILIQTFLRITKLSGALKSQTTQGQFKIALPIAIVFALAGVFVPEYLDTATVISAAMALAPLVSRALRYKDKSVSAEVDRLRDIERDKSDDVPVLPDPVDPPLDENEKTVDIQPDEVKLIKCRYRGRTLWFEFSGTMRQAVGKHDYDFGVDTNGVEWDLRGEVPTGKIIRLPKKGSPPVE